jgi:hypothetical protein
MEWASFLKARIGDVNEPMIMHPSVLFEVWGLVYDSKKPIFMDSFVKNSLVKFSIEVLQVFLSKIMHAVIRATI